jgi:DNA-binding transcriptional ArsR family regulator
MQPDRLHVPPARQWISTTSGRITTCAHSWMQAVHWVAGSGLYSPARSHGPQWGPTTLAIAAEVSALSECRPGIGYLMRKLRLSERTVQYHLAMLREAGLLVYRVKGSRVSGSPNQASVFERVIPAVFDEALGIRTTGEGATRRPVGAAPEHRKTLGKLAKKAARKVRRRPRKRAVSRGSRCTPMQGGTSAASSAGTTYSPPESKLASGEAESPTKKKSNRGPRNPKTLNKVGRRYQLARELISQVPWLQRAALPRIAWIARNVADAGWTALEVQAVAEGISPIDDHKTFRPSGMLAHRLRGAHDLYTTPASRQTAVHAWQESRIQEQARHTGFDDLGEGPRSPSARRAVDEAFAAIRDRLTDPSAAAVEVSADEPGLAIEDLTREQVIDLRAAAQQNPDLVLMAIDALGERDARRLYTNRLVDQTLALEAINARRDTLQPAF